MYIIYRPLAHSKTAHKNGHVFSNKKSPANAGLKKHINQ